MSPFGGCCDVPGGCKEVPGQRWAQHGRWGDRGGEDSLGGHAFLCRMEHCRDARTREVLEPLVTGVSGG